MRLESARVFHAVAPPMLDRTDPLQAAAMEPRLPRTSELIAALPHAHDGERIAIGDLVHTLRNRAFGMTLVLFGIPNCIPMPPGIPVICGIILILASFPMILGRDAMWLPERISRRTISKAELERISARALPWIKRFEQWSRPRLPVFSGPTARRIVGAVVAFLGFVLILPIPFLGNMPPGIAICIFGLGLIERDGLVILFAFFATVVAMAVTIGMTWAIIAGASWLF
jgi:hypothetical protein